MIRHRSCHSLAHAPGLGSHPSGKAVLVNRLHATVNSRLLLRRYKIADRKGEESLRKVLEDFIRNCKALRQRAQA